VNVFILVFLWLIYDGICEKGGIIFLLCELYSHLRYFIYKIENILSSQKKYKQWPVFLLTVIFLQILWIRLLITRRNDIRCLWIVIGLLGIIFSLYWFKSVDKLSNKITNRKKRLIK